MGDVVAVNFKVGQFIVQAQAAVAAPVSQASVWAMAEYLDVVEAKEVPSNGKLVRQCKDAIQLFVAEHIADDTYVSLWERAGCLFRAYKRELRVQENCASSRLQLQA